MFKGRKFFALLAGFVILCTNVAYGVESPEGVTYAEQVFTIGESSISANVITVDLSNNSIAVTTESIGNSVRDKAALNKIVTDEKPIAVINAGIPDISSVRGNFMSNGELLLTSSGLTSMGITNKKEVVFGKPIIFSKVYTTDNSLKRILSWTIRDTNSLDQSGEQSILYTPVHGRAVTITNPGWICSVENTTIKSFYKVENGRQIMIPQSGYLIYFSEKFADTTYFLAPEIGRKVAIQYTSMKLDAEEFPLEDMAQIFSGKLRLIKNGIVNKDHGISASAGDLEKVGRSGAGCTEDGKLVFVYTAAATVDELSQIMKEAGCVNAISLNSGAACGMYVNGSYITLQTSQLSTVIMIKKTK